MKAKEKTSQTQTRTQKGSEKSKGGGRLDGKGATTNLKRKTKSTSGSNERKAF
jgi:hypothetical protein